MVKKKKKSGSKIYYHERLYKAHMRRREQSLCVSPQILKELGIPDKEGCIYLPELPLSKQGYPMYKGKTVISILRDSVTKRQLKNHATCHKCNNKLCVNPKHLYYGTRRDNWIDFVQSKGVFDFNLFFEVKAYDFSALDKKLEEKLNKGKPQVIDFIKK
jgi:hypothetical protein